MNPLNIILLVVLALNVVGVPYAHWLPHRNEQAIFSYTRYVSTEGIWTAYYWTLFGIAAIVLFAAVFGIFGQIRRYQSRPFIFPSPTNARVHWWWTFIVELLLIGVMFVQAGAVVPLLSIAISDVSDYAQASMLRTYFSTRVNENIYNVNLLLLAPLNLVLAFQCVRYRSFFYRLLSIGAFITTASFSLAKSQLAAALFELLIFFSLTHRVRLHTVVVLGLVILLLIAPFYLLFAYASDFRGVADLLTARMLYGQWAGLPYYFLLFETDRQPMEALLPPYVQRVLGYDAESPGRKVMKFIEPAAAAEGVAGNVPSFYVGEAYAVGGIPGVVFSPIVVSLELWILVACFRHLRKNVFTVVLFSWFLYKFQIGLLDGFSTFMISAFTLGLAALAVLVVTLEGARVPRLA